jgi:hypothetical protein
LSEKKLADLLRKKVSISDKYSFGVFSKKRFPIFFCEKSSNILFKKVHDFFQKKVSILFTGKAIEEVYLHK